jgi:molybdopterin molybdotransferase
VISEEEARNRILEKVSSLPERTVPLASAFGCFSARDVAARVPLPAFDNSAMDGYAVIASFCKKGERMPVTGEQPAGPDRRLRISPGAAIRVFTGAPVPEGTDAVVMQEDVTRDGEEIVINADVQAGEFVRRRGCDLAEGQKILAKGERIAAATVGLLASQGFAEVLIGGEVKAAILSTGDELVKPGGKLEAGQIYESNSALVAALLQRCGAIVQSQEHCRDDRESLIEAIKRGIESHVLIISGGVSVGERDLVKEALQQVGAHIDLWRVAIKPGKPFLFGAVPSKSSDAAGETPAGPTGSPRDESVRLADKMPVLRDCFVFGLPGNPVSAFVTFLQFVRPAILKMMGATDLDLPRLPAELTVGVVNEGDRPHYIRGKLERATFTPVGRQESHALFGLSQSNALLRLTPGQSLKAGQIVNVQIWD